MFIRCAALYEVVWDELSLVVLPQYIQQIMVLFDLKFEKIWLISTHLKLSVRPLYWDKLQVGENLAGEGDELIKLFHLQNVC